MRHKKDMVEKCKIKIKEGASYDDVRREMSELDKLTFRTYKKWYADALGKEYVPPTYISKITLKIKYKFSDSWIKRLGPPDKEVRNPYYSCSPSMKLYVEKRVVDFIEANKEDYMVWLERRKKFPATQKWRQYVPRRERFLW